MEQINHRLKTTPTQWLAMKFPVWNVTQGRWTDQTRVYTRCAKAHVGNSLWGWWYLPGNDNISHQEKRQIIDSEVLAGRGYVTSKEGFWRIVGQAMKKIEKFETSKTFCQCIGSNFLCGHGCRKGFQEGAEGHAFLRGLRMPSLS